MTLDGETGERLENMGEQWAWPAGGREGLGARRMRERQIVGRNTDNNTGRRIEEWLSERTHDPERLAGWLAPA